MQALEFWPIFSAEGVMAGQPQKPEPAELP
jgi:hypothetical protein